MKGCNVVRAFLPFWLALQLYPQAPPRPKPAKPAPAAGPKRDTLTNDGVIRMVAAGLGEDIVLTAIKNSTATFAVDADNLIRLQEAKVPPAVLRAMLAKNAPAAPAVVVAPPPVVVAPPPPPPIVPDRVMARQGTTLFPLTNRPQKVLFIKSEATDVKTAVANILLSDVGLQLLTMGMSSQMMMWNPYMGDTIAKAASLGKGMLLNRGSDTKGFEVETLPGLTADVTLKEGKTELFVPITRYLASANFDPATMEPVLLKLDSRDKDQSRVLSGRKVLIKQEKKGRFDMKPVNERQESNVEQNIIPVTVERLPDNIIKVTTNEALKRGEYALVFRRPDPAGAFTTNVPLKPEAQSEATSAASTVNPAALGMSPEMMAMMSPEQLRMVQQQMQGANGPPPQGGPQGGMFGRMKRGSAPPPPPSPSDGPITGFLAWDFRVIP